MSKFSLVFFVLSPFRPSPRSSSDCVFLLPSKGRQNGPPRIAGRLFVNAVGAAVARSPLPPRGQLAELRPCSFFGAAGSTTHARLDAEVAPPCCDRSAQRIRQSLLPEVLQTAARMRSESTGRADVGRASNQLVASVGWQASPSRFKALSAAARREQLGAWRSRSCVGAVPAPQPPGAGTERLCGRPRQRPAGFPRSC